MKYSVKVVEGQVLTDFETFSLQACSPLAFVTKDDDHETTNN